jgi:lysophospholipase L1-like esterase
VATVVCFGDSLTWGARPDRRGRHAPRDRWPVAMGAALGRGVEVISEGLNGRMTAYDAHHGPVDRNGARALPSILHAQAPLDLVAILLGTNDVLLLEASAARAARGMRRLVEIVRHHPYPAGGVPKVLLVAPPPLVRDPEGLVSRAAVTRSAALADAYARLAAEEMAGFFDAGTAIRSSALDGVHLDADQSRALGPALAPRVRTLLG